MKRSALLLSVLLLLTAGAVAKKKRRKKKAAAPATAVDAEMESILQNMLTANGGERIPDAVAFNTPGEDDLWQRPPVLLQEAQIAFGMGHIARGYRLCFAAYMHAVTRGDERGFTPPDVRVKYSLAADELKKASELHMSFARLLIWHHDKTNGRTLSSTAIEEGVNAELGLDQDPENPNATRDRYKADGLALTPAEYSANMRAHDAAGTFDRSMAKIRSANRRTWAEAGGLDASTGDHAANELNTIDEIATGLLDDVRFSRPLLSTSESEQREWAESLASGMRVRIHDLAGAADSQLRDETLMPDAPMLDDRPATLVRFDPGTARWLLTVDAHAGFSGPEPLPGHGSSDGREDPKAEGAEAAAVTASVRTANLAPLIWRGGRGGSYTRRGPTHDEV